MNRMNDTDFESVLGDLLQQRAAKATVVGDLDAILVSKPPSSTEPELVRTGRSHWLLAAAALLILVVAGSVATRSTDEQDSLATSASSSETTAPSPIDDSLAAATRPLESDELIVWLEPWMTARELDGIVAMLEGATLEGEALTTSWVYVDIDQTWDEFSEFWADTPEVIDAVDPHHLPTSLRLTTPDPAALVSAIDRADLPAVMAIEGADFIGSCSQRPACIDVRIDQVIADFEARGASANGSLAIIEDRTITDDEVDLLRIRLQACVDMMPSDEEGNAFVASIGDDLIVIPYSGTSQLQLDRFERCADEMVGDLPAILRLLRAEGQPVDDE